LIVVINYLSAARNLSPRRGNRHPTLDASTLPLYAARWSPWSESRHHFGEACGPEWLSPTWIQSACYHPYYRQRYGDPL